SVRFLRAVFDGIPDLFSIIDRDHRIVLSNYHGGFDYVPDDVRDGFPHCYRAYYGRDAVCEPCHAEEVFATGKPSFCEKFNPRIGYLEIRSFPIFDDAGRVILVAEHVHDITARKIAEESLAGEKERLAVTLRSIGDGVITTDTEGKIVLINKVAEQLTGWSQEEALGRHLSEVFRIIGEKSRKPCPDPVTRVLGSGITVELANHTLLVSRDGKERTIADSAAPIRDRESRVVGAVLVFRDITEKRKMEEELLKSQKLESIGVLAGGIAHDFNNLLTAILGNISLAKMYVSEGDKVHQKLVEAEKASLRARDLTQQLLTFSRGGAPVKKTAAVTDIIRDSVAFTLSGSRATYRFSMADDLWPVEVDEGQMSQVINNLILNADQAMPSGGVIEVGCSNLTVGADSLLPLRSGRYVVITITDEGIGIPEEALPRIFDPYFSTKKDGKGLGLATVYSIIRNHDGHITVQSTPGAGTTFTIYLPASGGGAIQADTEETADHTGKATVLVMDDEENIREVAGEMLKFIGYDVEFAGNGEEAVTLYRNAWESGEPFVAVLMDLTIPGGMGGKEAVRMLQDIDPGVKAIVSSGYSNDPILADYRSYGFSGIITKPYKLGDLKKMLATVTG
ncbi:MAG: PAS domain S-box protein, partial [Geobacteraceae bacterium]|nr:PAS domain S-box protein [Geobacteraceae bacterium]